MHNLIIQNHQTKQTIANCFSGRNVQTFQAFFLNYNNTPELQNDDYVLQNELSRS